MEHEGWDITDNRWIQLDFLWLISGEILIRTQPLARILPVTRSRKCSRSLLVSELRIGLLPSGSLRILARVGDCWEASVYSGTYWYGLYTGLAEEKGEPIEEQDSEAGS